MNTDIQAVADAPLKAGKLKRAILARLRHMARIAVYGFGPIRRRLERAPQGGTHWDHLFSETNFATYLSGTIEIELRNSIVSTLIRLNAPVMPSVLDVGCAGGSLVQALPTFRQYLGTDISQVAVNTAKQFCSPTVTFRVTDLDRFDLSQKWDVIVFNEVLYYLSVDDAATEFARYMAALSPDGCAIVSMKNDPKSHAIYRLIEKQFHLKRAVLWQPKDDGLNYKIEITQERPAFLVACFQHPTPIKDRL